MLSCDSRAAGCGRDNFSILPADFNPPFADNAAPEVLETDGIFAEGSEQLGGCAGTFTKVLRVSERQTGAEAAALEAARVAGFMSPHRQYAVADVAGWARSAPEYDAGVPAPAIGDC